MLIKRVKNSLARSLFRILPYLGAIAPADLNPRAPGLFRPKACQCLAIKQTSRPYLKTEPATLEPTLSAVKSPDAVDFVNPFRNFVRSDPGIRLAGPAFVEPTCLPLLDTPDIDCGGLAGLGVITASAITQSLL